MANALFRKLTDGSWLNQGCPGAPAMFRVNHSNDSSYYAYFTWDGINWIQLPGNGASDPVTSQTRLDTYMANMNAGTA